MSKIDDLQASVDKATEKVEKCKATIVRHEAHKAKKLAALVKQGVDINDLKAAKEAARLVRKDELMWAIFEVEHKDDDIIGATKKLKAAEVILANWLGRYNVEVEKERFLSENAPAVIIEFLNQWKEKARDWYIKAHAKYLEMNTELKVAKQEAEQKYILENPGKSAYSVGCSDFIKKDEQVKFIVGAMTMMGGEVARLATYRVEMDRLAYLEKMLEEDRKAKMIDLIHRINAVVGTITDATKLRISAKGNLDGFIVGEGGKAKIETIGAGGYNIQVFHYRTLVHKMKESE